LEDCDHHTGCGTGAVEALDQRYPGPSCTCRTTTQTDLIFTTPDSILSQFPKSTCQDSLIMEIDLPQ
jgi:hypothetical protein